MKAQSKTEFDFDAAADSQLATIKQTSHILQVTRQTVYRLNKQGNLPFVRIGCQPRVRVADLRKLIGGAV